MQYRLLKLLQTGGNKLPLLFFSKLFNNIHTMKKENPAKKFEKCLDISDRFDLFFTERASLPIAKVFCKLDASPSFVSVLGGLFGVGGAVLLVFNNLICTIIGILMIIFCAILDCADGQVARISHKGSMFGRCFDGTIDSVVYFAIYLCLAIRIIFFNNIPFTDTPWFSWWGLGLFVFIVIFGVFIHAAESRIADYYRNAYMYLSASDRGSELHSSEDMKRIVDETPKGFQKFVLKSYISYTKLQEKSTPKLQELLKLIKDNGGEIPSEVSSFYRERSKKIARLPNILVFNFRTYVLFGLLLATEILRFVGVCDFTWELLIFPIVLLVLEPIRLMLIHKFEKIAGESKVLMEKVLDERKEKKSN